MAELKKIADPSRHRQLASDKDEGIASALRESRSQYHELIEEMPDGYLEFDLKGNVTSCNQATLDMCMQTRQGLLGLPFRAYMSPETAERVYKAYNEVYQTGIPKKGLVHEILLCNGSRLMLQCSVSLRKKNGRIVGFRSIWHDITARKKMEAALANHRSRLEAIFASVKEGIIALDGNGVVIDANTAVETICGVRVEQMIQKPLTGAHTSCGQNCGSILRNTLTRGIEIKECQIWCKRQDRPQQIVALNSSPLVDSEGRSMGAVLVFRDITERMGSEKELRGRHRFHNLIGKSQKMQEIYDFLENLANIETTVLITGQSGTGKELVARALHHAGERSDKSFIKVSCSALSESLLESELFGHVKGAFTGAIKDRPGRFEMADGGTILLDEIGDVSPLIQLKLLRVLQEKEFERVGESIPRKVDVRVIACTNKNLKEKVRSGEFREDLYYRLKVFEIPLPLLRDRREDLPLLVDHFCREFNEHFKKKIEGVSSSVMRRFMNYEWQGNVRELQHVLEHAFVLCNEPVIHMAHLPAEMRNRNRSCAFANSNESPESHKKIYEYQEVLAALEQSRWNKTRAAQLLGVHRRTIHRKIKKYRLLEF